MHICLFDIDGTLIWTQGAGRKSLLAAMNSEFGIADFDHQIQTTGRTDRGIARDLFARYELENNAANWERLHIAYLHHLQPELAKCEGRVLPGILEMLYQLQNTEHVFVGLMTGNTSRGAEIKLGHFDLFDHFSFGTFGENSCERDDLAREALVQIHSQFGSDFPCENIWVIGDTPLDVQCAKAINATSVAVATGSHTVDELLASQADHVLEDLSDASVIWNAWQR